MANPKGDDSSITILLVDDIAETRESIKKLLAFEQDFKVVGSASNGREGVELAKELEPDIIIMDINMPDMDGLEAAGLITKAVPTAGVIMMSVQSDHDYMQRAMLAGARFFLSKPVNMDQLYSTIRNVYQQYESIRATARHMAESFIAPPPEDTRSGVPGDRAGHIIAVYSPQGGAGCTTVATSLASGLMRDNSKTLLIDCDLEFGDVGVFLEMRSQSTLSDLVANADDLDVEYFDSIVMTHDSGMKVLLGPPRPLFGAEIRDTRPDSVASIIKQVRGYYDFIILDMGKSIDAVADSLLQLADKIVLLTVPTLPSIKNSKLVLDMFEQAGFPAEKTVLVINRALEQSGRNAQRVIPTAERIQSFLRRPVEGVIPVVDETIILNAINRGLPVIAADRDTGKAPIKQLMQLSDHLYTSLMGEEDVEVLGEDPSDSKSSTSPFRIFGRR
jgi:pilus assembly protein CpaE